MNNPFTPTFGTVPLYMAGREKILADINKAFENWKGNPNITSIFIGARGSGKTAMLSAAGDLARKAGWIVVDVSAYTGMLDDIIFKIQDQAEEILPAEQKSFIKELKVKDFGIAFEHETAQKDEPSWRIRMGRLMDRLRSVNAGVLITVDEVLPKVEEMIELVAEYQILQRNGCKISLLMAGLPKNADDLLNEKSVSFLRRARRHMIGRVSDEEVSKALTDTMKRGGKNISGKPLDEAVQATAGFPYMIQLVGYYIFEEAGTEKNITVDSAQRGIAESVNEFTNGVLYNTISDLSEKDMGFLYAMLEDEDGSRLSDIAKRMNRTNGYAYTYKVRLLHSGVIDEKNKVLNFALPLIKDYLNEQKDYLQKT